MKRSLITFAAASSALFLAGCNNQKDCIEAVSKANQSSFDAVAKQAEAMLLALKGDDAQAKGMALMWFATQDKRLQVMGYGDCNRDGALEWAKVLVNPFVGVFSIIENNKTARHSSDNSVRMQEVNMGTLGAVAEMGIEAASKDPLVVHPVVIHASPTPVEEPAPADPAPPAVTP